MILPDILAGPIVRRSDAHAIHVWICTSRPLDLGLTVHETNSGADKKLVALSPEIGRGIALRRLRLGEKLFVHLLKAVPVAAKGTPDPFPRGQLLAYDIRKLNLAKPENFGPSILTPAVRTAISLNLTDELPSIILQKDSVSDLRAIYGSCRKLHGGGKDAFVNVFAARYRAAPHSLNRPNALFLLGDQIYADDVSDLLLPTLEKLGRELVGFRDPLTKRLVQEQVPDKNGVLLPPSAFSVGFRQKISDDAGFTTEEGANHLARFGEFAAMHLLAWTGDGSLWPGNALDARLAFLGRVKTSVDETDSDSLPPGLGEVTERMIDQIKSLLDARVGSRALRRILANTPTYMIFDDHDVTDDWNFTPAWQARVEKNPLGRRIVANALAAYTVFQGWGNDPESFTTSSLLDSIETRLARRAASAASIAAYESELWKFPKWSFVTPTVPPALFVDSRTRRHVSPVGYEYEWKRGSTQAEPAFHLTLLARQSDASPAPASFAPCLVDEAGGHYLRTLIGNSVVGKCLILATPGPVFDAPLLELGKVLLNKLHGPLPSVGRSAEEVDLEAWMTNRHSFLRLMDLLDAASPGQVVMLSGDVHYAFSATGLIESTFTASGTVRTIDFKLFNSSAAKNRPEGALKKSADILGTLSPSTAVGNLLGTGRYDPQQLFFVGQDSTQHTYYGPTTVKTRSGLASRIPGLKRLYSIDLTFGSLRVNGANLAALVINTCNLGYLTFDRTDEDPRSELIAR